MVRLEAGRASGVTACRVQASCGRVSSVLYETGWEIRLKKDKEEDVSVNLVEPREGPREILGASHAFEKADALTIRFRRRCPQAAK